MRFKILKFRKTKKVNPEDMRVVKYHVDQSNRKLNNRSQKRFRFPRVITPQLIIFILLMVLVIGSFAYIILNREKYILKNISISGNNLIKKEELDESLSKFIGQNIFIVFPSQIESYLYNNFELIKTVKVQKTLPDTISLDLIEKNLGVLIVNPSSYEIWDLDGNEVKKTDITPSLELSENTLKILSGKFNLEEIPLTSDQALRKNKILLVVNEEERNKQLEKFDKDILSYRITEFRKLQEASYKEAITNLKDKVPQINKYELPYFFIEANENNVNKKLLIEHFLKIQTTIDLPPELVFISSFGNITLLSSNKLIRLEGNENIDKQIKALNTLQKTLEETKTNYFQITITGEKVAVL